MANYTIPQLAHWVKGHILGDAAGGLRISHLATDSRKIAFPESTIFFALVTAKRNGHHYVAAAYALGVRAFVVSSVNGLPDVAGAAFIVVPDVLAALQQMAAAHRSQFSLPVIGITGSNGKTVVKEWLYQLLHHDFNIVRSPKSYNSQIGVPLSVWQLNGTHTLGVFEAGISRQGEMAALAAIIQPTLGILTNIGPAHSEGFADAGAKLLEKLRLFEHADAIIARAKDLTLLPDGWLQDTGAAMAVIGEEEEHIFRILQINKEKAGTGLKIVFKQKANLFFIPFTDDASIENAITCICTLLWMRTGADSINQRLSALHPVEMRLEWKRGINQCHILNDSYSNDLAGLEIALSYLVQQQQGGRLTVILSDFQEAPQPGSDGYGKVLELIKRFGIRRFITVGPQLYQYAGSLQHSDIQYESFATTALLLKAMAELQFSHENILIKGARVFGFEKLVQALEQQVHETVLEINLTAVADRLKYYQALLPPPTKTMVMLKAFGYGSGDAEIARLLQFSGVDYLAVAYTDEGVALRKSGIHLPIMVMNPEASGFSLIEQYNLEPELYDFSILTHFISWCHQQGLEGYPVHLKLDTGMHRLGFEPHQMEALATVLCGQGALTVKSVFTHLVASEDAEQDGFTLQQAQLFESGSAALQQALGYSFLRHAANTAAIRRHPHLHYDMVRVGIGLYAGNAPQAGAGFPTVLTLKTTIAQIKRVKAGDSVGYGRSTTLQADATIATVRIGYADGYRRLFSNGVGCMLVHGKPVRVVGRVCMDMTMLDVSAIEGVRAGDSVEVFGPNLPLETLAQQGDTIIYEIITGISQRVKRVYVSE